MRKIMIRRAGYWLKTRRCMAGEFTLLRAVVQNQRITMGNRPGYRPVDKTGRGYVLSQAKEMKAYQNLFFYKGLSLRDCQRRFSPLRY